MELLPRLCVFALKELLPGACRALGIEAGAEAVEAVQQFLADRFTDHSCRLSAALQGASERAWKALEIALAGESFWNRLDRREDRALRLQVRAFLDALPPEQLPVERDEFRRQCLQELRAARQAKLLGGGALDVRRLARQTADFARFADPRRLLDAEWQLIQGLAETLGRYGHAQLARLLALRPHPGQPLLAVAVRYFFRQAVEEDRQLFQGLAWAAWEGLAEAQEHGFAQLHQALVENGKDLDLRLGELLDRVGEIHGAILDIQEEQQRQGDQHRHLYEAILDLRRRLDRLADEARPADGLSLHNEAERQLIQAVLAHYRALAPEQQRQRPALLQGIACLQLRVGDVAGANESFDAVSAILTDRKALAEAHYHAYRAALERRDWPKAFASYQQAATLDPEAWTEGRLLAEIGAAFHLAEPEARDCIHKARV